MPKELILENSGLVYSIANSMYDAEKDDLIQAGFLGLVKAYKKYNPENANAKFSSYAYGFVYGEMYEVATGNKPARVRKPELRLYKGVLKAKELLETKLNREVSYEEACAFTKVDFNLFISILNALSSSVCIEEHVDKIGTNSDIENRLLLKECLESLTPLERSIIEKRYLEDKSQDETAKILGLTQVKVSRLEKASKDKMKSFVNS